MFTGTTSRKELRIRIPGVEGVWFGTPQPDGSARLRRHGKVSRSDAITDVVIRENKGNPNNRWTILVHVLGNDEALVLTSLSELSALARSGRLVPELAQATAPRGWDFVTA
jgi:hypothetical protein